MALDAQFRTTQEYLNNKCGFTGALRTKQECLAHLSGRKVGANLLNTVSSQDCINTYAGVSGKISQLAYNNKAGEIATTVTNTLTKQEAARRF